MSDNQPIQMPAGYAPATAVGFADSAGEMVLISADNPLPISNLSAPPTPLAGSASASSSVGPFEPVAERPVMIQLGGNWEGSVQLLRSVDDGATKSPVTLAGSSWALYTTNVLEPAWQEAEAGVELYLDIALTSGVVDYRVSQ